MKYSEAQIYKTDNPIDYQAIKTGVKDLIDNKTMVITGDDFRNHSLGPLSKLIFEEYGDGIDNYKLKRGDRLIGLLLLDILELELDKTIVNEVKGMFSMFDDYLELIKQPKLNHRWYTHLDQELIECGLIKLNRATGTTYRNLLNSLLNDDDRKKNISNIKHLFRFERYYFSVINELSIALEEYYDITSIYLNMTRHSSYVYEAIKNKCIDIEYGKRLLEYVGTRQDKDDGSYITACISGISLGDFDYAYTLATKLFDNDTERCIRTLAYMYYSQTDELVRSFDFVESKSTFSEKSRINFYYQILNTDLTNPDIAKRCFEELGEVLKSGSDSNRNEILTLVGWLREFDNHKDIICDIAVDLNISFDASNYYRYYSDQRKIFAFLTKNYNLLQGQIDVFRTNFNELLEDNPKSFHQEVLKLFSSSNVRDALLAIEIIKSKYLGSYILDYSSMEESDQITVLNRIRKTPFMTNDLFPIMMEFSKSKYPVVILEFENMCKGYIDAYGNDFLLYVENNFDSVVHKELIIRLKDYNQKLEAIYLKKREINEFNPMLNSYDILLKYNQYDHRKRSDMQKMMHKNSGSFNIFKNISVIRGSAFKSEKNPRINVMGSVRSSQLLDKRIYEDPIKYENDYNDEFKIDGQ